jgi:membrane protein required for colicin V production
MGEVSVTIVDLTIAIVVLVSAIFATWRGLLRETLSVFSWAVAAYLSLRFFPSFRSVLRAYISPEWLADLTVLIGIFMIVLVPLSYMSYRFSETVKRTEIGPVDRALGFVFGIGRGLVVVGIAYITFSILVPPQSHPSWLTQARLFPVVENTSDVLLSLVPPPEDMPLTSLTSAPVVSAPPPAQAQPQTAQQQAAPPQTAQNPLVEADAQTYGAEERAALDRLIESTGAP